MEQIEKDKEIEEKRKKREEKTKEILQMKQLQKRNPEQFKKLLKDKL